MPLTPPPGYRLMALNEVIDARTRRAIAGLRDLYKPSAKFMGWTFAKRLLEEEDSYDPDLCIYIVPIDGMQPPFKSGPRLPPNKIPELPLP